MEKEKLFSVYEKLYSENFGKIPCCENCTCLCEKVKYSVLFPFEDDFIKWRTGKEIAEPNIELGRLKVKIIGKKCQHTDTKDCLIYNSRPIDCRLYPFYVQLNNKGLHLYIDRFCPLAMRLAQDTEVVNKVKSTIIELDKAIGDDSFWKIYSSTMKEEWDETVKPQKVCDIFEK